MKSKRFWPEVLVLTGLLLSSCGIAGVTYPAGFRALSGSGIGNNVFYFCDNELGTSIYEYNDLSAQPDNCHNDQPIHHTGGTLGSPAGFEAISSSSGVNALYRFCDRQTGTAVYEYKNVVTSAMNHCERLYSSPQSAGPPTPQATPVSLSPKPSFAQ